MSKQSNPQDLNKEATSAETGSKAEDYMKKNRRTLIICLVAAIVVIGGIILYRNAYMMPHRAKAEEQIFRAEQLFERDSFETALKGNGTDVKGFLDIISDYGNTPSGNVAHAYAGGDQYDKAVGYFEDAAKKADNMLLSPIYLIKAGLAYEALGKTDKAKEAYTKVKESYPTSPSAANAEKYLQTLILQGK